MASLYCSSIEGRNVRVPYGGRREDMPERGGGGGLCRVDSGRPWEVGVSWVREAKRDGWGWDRI